MVNRREQLRQLQKIAQIKSDLEQRNFAAFRQHVTALETRRDDLCHQLAVQFDDQRPFSIAAARLANTLAGFTAGQIHKTDAEIAQITPKYDLARQRAAKEFGRAQILAELCENAKRDHALKKAKTNRCVLLEPQ